MEKFLELTMAVSFGYVVAIAMYALTNAVAVQVLGYGAYAPNIIIF